MALNAKGIVHRDLKPQNILLCHSGQTNPHPSEIHLKIGKYVIQLLNTNTDTNKFISGTKPMDIHSREHAKQLGNMNTVINRLNTRRWNV